LNLLKSQILSCARPNPRHPQILLPNEIQVCCLAFDICQVLLAGRIQCAFHQLQLNALNEFTFHFKTKQTRQPLIEYIQSDQSVFFIELDLINMSQRERFISLFETINQ